MVQLPKPPARRHVDQGNTGDNNPRAITMRQVQKADMLDSRDEMQVPWSVQDKNNKHQLHAGAKQYAC